MGLRLRGKKPKAVPGPTRLRALSNEDLYLYVESGLMNCQMRLSEYRGGDFLSRPARLDQLAAEFEQTALGIEEMQFRSS